MRKIPAHVREQQINALPDITFVRWDGDYLDSKSKAVCRCAIDGFEWSVGVCNLINQGKGCPQCAGVRRWTADERVEQISSLSNTVFVHWLTGEYRNCYSKAVCRCTVDDHEWSATVSNLLNGSGCPKCAVLSRGDKQRRPACERVEQINNIPNIAFVRWDGGYNNVHSKAVVRCLIDGHEWSVGVTRLINNGNGCPKCAVDKQRTPADERVKQINALPGITFIRWYGEYRGHKSKAVCHCVNGHEWAASVNNMLNNGTGCPHCAEYGYNTSKPAALYALRSECGSMVKIGISNNLKQRLRILRRKTPFAFECVELCHGDGALIAGLEKAFHGMTNPAVFKESFDGYTEWREWDQRIPEWFSNWREMVQCR